MYGLQDEGCGVSNGLSINMIFCRQEGVPIFHNAEVAPPVDTITKGVPVIWPIVIWFTVSWPCCILASKIRG